MKFVVKSTNCAEGRVDRGCRHLVKGGQQGGGGGGGGGVGGGVGGGGGPGGALSAALALLRGASAGKCWAWRLETKITHRLQDNRRKPPSPPPLACPACSDVLQGPVTGSCGHTLCAGCVRGRCPACGARFPPNSTCTNVLVQGLVERWWSGELLSARAARDAERLLLHQGDIDAALNKCDKALGFSPNSHQVLAIRSKALNFACRYSEALSDADAVTKLRPTWSKGHFLRGITLSNMNQHDEALTSFFVSACLGHDVQSTKKHVTLCLARLIGFSGGENKCRKMSIVRNGKGFRRKSLCRSFRNRICKCQFIKTSPCNNEANNKPLEPLEMEEIIDKIFREVNKYEEMTPVTPDLQVESILVDQSDFECILCCRSLWRPVTTPCGHTYCMDCLERCLDYSSSCPLCMTSLSEYLADNSHNITTFIDEAMKNFIPMEYIARKISHSQELTGSYGCEPNLPVFVCTTAFPTISCPLYVFEPRYRLMIRRCLESGTRQFGIAALPDKNATGLNRYAEFGTVLEIKDCVLLSNGCSILSTIGVKRFRVLSRGERDGYDMAQIETVQDNPIEAERDTFVTELHDKVRRKAWLWFKDMDEVSKNEIIQTIGCMPAEEEDWRTLTDGPSWTWWVVAILPLATQLKVMILATSELEKRLRAIDRTLDYIYFLKKQTFAEERSLSFSEQPADYFNTPWMASSSTLGEQSM